MPLAGTFQVELAGAGRGRQRVTVRALTPHLACDMAEKSHPGWNAVAVLHQRAVAGRCSNCGSVVFADEGPHQTDGPRLRCFDC